MATDSTENLLPFLLSLKDGKTDAVVHAQVVGYFMYLRDYSCPDELRDSITLYDLMIRGLGFHLKCTLHPKLNKMIEKGYVKSGSIIKITKAHMISAQDSLFVVDSFLVVLDYETFPDKDLSPLIQPRKHVDPAPLFSRRGYYLNPWVTDVPYGHGFSTVIPVPIVEPLTSASMAITLIELDRDARSMIMPYPPLVLTILHRGKLHHYGKYSDRSFFPFQGYLVVGDHTGICRAVLWDDMNSRYFKKLVPGCFLVLRRYSIREIPFEFRRNTITVAGRCKLLPVLQQELNINTSSKIRIITKDEAKKHCSSVDIYPVSKYRFIDRQNLSYLPDNSVVDITGVVTHVGHFMREADPKKTGNFIVHRFLEMIDNSTPLPFLIHLYVHYPVEEYQYIVPGDVYTLTHLSVSHFVDPQVQQVASKSERSVHLVSTVYTRIVREFCSDKCLSLRTWIRRFRDELSAVFRIGGFVSYMSSVKEKSRDGLLLKTNDPTTTANLCEELENLSLREHKVICTRGIITSVYLLHVKGTTIVKELIYDDFENRKHNSLASNDWSLAFPQLWPSKCSDMEALLRWLSLPPFCASSNDMEPLSEDQRTKLPFSAVDGFSLTVLNQDQDTQITVFFFPVSSLPPHPSLIQLLTNQYQTRYTTFEEKHDWESVHIYSPSEVIILKESCRDISCTPFNFVIDLFCYNKKSVVAMLRSASST